MQGGYAGQICDGQRNRSRTDRIHNQEQTQAPRDIVEDGAEDSGSLEDEPGQISAPGGTDLYEAGGIDEHQIRDICSFNHVSGAGDTFNGHRDTAMMSDVILPLIGIVLIALIMVVWL